MGPLHTRGRETMPVNLPSLFDVPTICHKQRPVDGRRRRSYYSFRQQFLAGACLSLAHPVCWITPLTERQTILTLLESGFCAATSLRRRLLTSRCLLVAQSCYIWETEFCPCLKIPYQPFSQVTPSAIVRPSRITGHHLQLDREQRAATAI